MKFFSAIQRECPAPDLLARVGDSSRKLLQAGACGLVAMVATAGIAAAAGDNPADWPVYHGNSKSCLLYTSPSPRDS